MIQFRYEPKFDDFWMLNRRHLLVKMRVRWLLPFAVGLFAVYCLSPWIPNLAQDRDAIEVYLSGWKILILPLLIGYLYGAVYWGAKKRWKLAAELRSPKDYQFSEAGIRVVTAGAAGEFDWSHIASVDYDRDWVFMATHQGSYHFFPLSGVSDPEALRQMLDRNVG